MLTSITYRFRLLIGLALLVSGAFGQTVVAVATITSLTLNPSTVAGGRGGTSTATVTLSEPAPTGGIVLTISSSNTALAASVPSITVPPGATSATFTVGTNPVYRQYSGLAFTVTISVVDPSTRSTRSATLTVTAQPRPPDILGPDSDMSGLICGGALPDNAVLLSCVKGPNLFTPGPCSFVQECPLGCQDLPDQGTTLNAACATTSPFPVSLNPTYVVGGGSANGTSQLPEPAPANSNGYVQSFSPFASVSSPTNFSFATGATSAGFTISTQAVGVPSFVAIDARNVVPEPAPGGGTFFAGRTGLTWLTLSPPANAPHPRLTSVTLNPASMQECGSSQGTVTLSPAPAGAVQVLLGSDRPQIVDIPNQLPYSVVVPGGATSANFTVSAGAVTTTTTVNISATLTGVTVTTPLTVTDLSGPGLSTISVNPSAVVGGETSTGTVTLSAAAPAGGVVVSLFSNPPVTVPLNVIVPAGQTSASFTISTAPVTFGTVVGITAALGCVAQSASLMVTTPPTGPVLSSLALNPVSVTGGASSTGTATLSAAAPSGGQTVTLSSGNAAGASVPASVTVPSGATSTTFTVSTAAVASSTVVTITGASGGATNTANLGVNPPPPSPALSAVTVNPTSVVGGTSSTGTVTLSAAAPSGGAVVLFSSSTTAAATVPASVTVAASATTATFTVSTTPVSASTSATVSGTFGGATRSAVLTVSPPASLSAASVNPPSVTGGTASQGTVTLTSAAPAGGFAVTLSSNNASATVPPSVTVAASATSATVAIATSAVTASTPVTITASAGSVTRTATLTVNPPGQSATLTVTASGRSGERVTSSPAGISVAVGSTGSASFATGTSITLSVSNGRDAVWAGACSSGGNKAKSCTFTLTGPASVTANVN